MYEDVSPKQPDCPPVNCKKKLNDCCVSFRKFVIPAMFSDEEGDYKTVNGLFYDTIVEYEQNGHIYLYSSDGIPTRLKGEPADAKLYSTTGVHEDGAMTQKATTEALNEKQDELIAGPGISILDDAYTRKTMIMSSAGVVDDELSETSEHPVQNKVIAEALGEKADISSLPDITPLATKAELTDGLATKVDTTTLADYTTKTYVDTEIERAVQELDTLDYKVADSVPTPTEVVIGGQTETTQEGVRYLVKHATDARYEEYMLIDGVVYDIGFTGDIDLSTYYTKTETDDLLDAKANTSALANYATTATADDLQAQIDALGEPFRVKQWQANGLNVTIPTCTQEVANTSIPKLTFTISDTEGADYQIVGMISYEIFDAASGGNRINCWPVCQFTSNGQKELTVRFMCGGTSSKTAQRISAWVLLKRR